jgi:hypothetical protein
MSKLTYIQIEKIKQKIFDIIERIINLFIFGLISWFIIKNCIISFGFRNGLINFILAIFLATFGVIFCLIVCYIIFKIILLLIKIIKKIYNYVI